MIKITKFSLLLRNGYFDHMMADSKNTNCKVAIYVKGNNNINKNNLFSLSYTNFFVLCSLPHVGYVTIILF